MDGYIDNFKDIIFSSITVGDHITSSVFCDLVWFRETPLIRKGHNFMYSVGFLCNSNLLCQELQR